MSTQVNEERYRNVLQNLTDEYVTKLTDLWSKMFSEEMCNENLAKLVEHATSFYDDLVTESLDKKEIIENEIKRLEEEANTLRRLLKVDFDVVKNDNAPLYVIQSDLDKSLFDLRQQLSKRKDQIYELLLEQEALCEELGESPRALLDDPLPTEDELQDFRMHLDAMKGEKVNRLYEISDLRREIKNFLQALEINPDAHDEERLLNDRHIPLTKSTINGLKQMQLQYGNQLEEVRESIDNMKNKLSSLWDKLSVSPSTRTKFSKYTDYSQTTYDKFYRELDRCETLKRQNIKCFVDQIREEIVQWWDKTLKSDLERSRFSNFTNDCYTDDLLDLHEMELEDLKRYYYSNEKIFELIEERKTLWDRMMALEAKASEPGRYNNRGGQLLKEEKERKTIASKLPKIEAQLTELVNKFEEDHNRKFLVYGVNVLDLIARDWDQKRMEKEKVMSARKNGQTPLSKTIVSRTPMSARNATSIRKAPSSTNISSVPASNKRKLAPVDYSHPSAKRSLLTSFASPRFLKPSGTAQKTPFKSPMKKTRVIATTIRRMSGRKSGGAKKRRSNRTPQKPPRVIVTNSDSEQASEPDTYDSFQKHIEAEPNSRSSIIQPAKTNTRNNRSTRRLKTENAIPLPNPRLLRTPSKLNVMEQQSMMKSPGLSRTTSNSPLPGPSSRKLTTKNLPILI